MEFYVFQSILDNILGTHRVPCDSTQNPMVKHHLSTSYGIHVAPSLPPNQTPTQQMVGVLSFTFGQVYIHVVHQVCTISTQKKDLRTDVTVLDITLYMCGQLEL